MTSQHPLFKTIFYRLRWLSVLLALASQMACQSSTPARASASAPANVTNVTSTSASPKVDPLADSDADGLPDGIELRSFDDRANFRKWFTALAEQQFYQPSKLWNVEQRDCAGLVRFAFREALRAHDRIWFQAMNTDAVAPDVRAFTLERSPVGEKLFRTDYGTMTASDLSDGKLSEFADARTLKNYNATFISRDRRQAQAGDLLFFHQPWVHRYPYHVMIFLGAARQAGTGAADWVVYHTGSSADDKGEVRKARLAVLDQHPDARWRPVESNKHFLGFYRFKMLD